MNILVLSTTFPRFKGDHYANFIKFLLDELTKLSVKSTVVASHSPFVPKHVTIDETDIHRFVYFFPKKLQTLTYTGGIPHTLKSRPFAKALLLPFILSFFVSSLIYTSKKDLIHANWTLSAMVAIFVTFFRKRKIVLTIHGSDINHLPRSGKRYRLTKWILQKVDHIITVSSPLKKEIQTFGVDKNKISVIPNGVNLFSFAPIKKLNSPYELVWIGRMTNEKGLTYLLESIQMLKKKYPQIRLHLIGTGPDQSKLKDYAQQLSIEENILFYGQKSFEEVPELMKKMGIFVLSSLTEGCPLSLIEAMATGLPCVATSVGGTPDVISHEQNGLLANPEDPRSLSDNIERLIEDETLRTHISKNAIKTIEQNFSWEAIAKKTHAVYQKTLAS